MSEVVGKVDAIPQVRVGELSISQLVTVFNRLNVMLDRPPIRVFSTKSEAVRRTTALLVFSYPGASAAMSGIVTLPNGVTFNHQTLEFTAPTTRKEGDMPETDETTTSEAKAPKAKKAKAPKAPKADGPPTAREISLRGIAAGLTNEQIAEEIAKEHPDAKSAKISGAWYRKQLEKGKITNPYATAS